MALPTRHCRFPRCELDAQTQRAASSFAGPAELDVWQLASSPDPDLHAVSSTLATIPELATATIRFANSASIAAAYPVGTVLQAVVRTGCRTVASLAAVAAGRSIMSSFGDSDTWSRALVVSRGAKTIARLSGLGHEPSEQAFVAGLFVEFGSAMLAKRDSSYRTWRAGMYKQHVATEDVLDRERERYGADHAMLSGQILDGWNFPPVISTAMAMHHGPANDLERVLEASLAIIPDNGSFESCVNADLEQALEPLDLTGHADFIRHEAALFADSAVSVFR